MTAYDAIQNPTDWNLKKTMEKLENKEKAKSRDNNNINGRDVQRKNVINNVDK